MSKQWMRIALVITLALALNGSSVQHSVQAALTDAAAVIHFGCDVSGCTYNPSEVVIQPGDTVEWDGEFSVHPLVSDDGLWTTHTVGTSFQYTFTMTGTFLYHCAVHGGFGGVGMSGRVIVKELPNKIYLPLVVK
jgi:plastocyanin